MYRHITNAKTRIRRHERKSIRREVRDICHEIELNSDLINSEEFMSSHDNWEQIRLK